jgi:hypothetical protein
VRRALVLVELDEESGCATFLRRRFGHADDEVVVTQDGRAAEPFDDGPDDAPRNMFELAQWLTRPTR